MLALLLNTLFFLVLSQALSFWLYRRTPDERMAIITAGLSCYLPIFALFCLLISYAISPPVSFQAEERFVWMTVLMLVFSAIYGVMLAGDAGRWQITDDKTLPGARSFKAPRWGGFRKPIVMQRMILVPRTQPRSIRRARQLFGFLSILLAVNSINILSEQLTDNKPRLANTPILFMPSAISMVLVEKLANPEISDQLPAIIMKKKEPEKQETWI